MKKTLAILMVLAVVTGSVFAQAKAAVTPAAPAAAVEAPAAPAKPAKAMPKPTVTYGLTAAAEINLIKENTENLETVTGDATTPATTEATARPYGLKATKFVISPWFNFDWSKMSIKAEGTYNAYDANLTDYSKMAVTTIWKDFFGFEIKDEVSKNNKGIKDAKVSTDAVAYNNVTLGTLDHNITITYDRMEESGFKFYTKYDAANVYSLFNLFSTGSAMQGLTDDFKEIGFALENEEIATNLVYKQGQVFGQDNGVTVAAINRFDTAWFEARKLFGMWTARLNDSAEMSLRLADLGSDSKIDRTMYGVGKGNNILGGIKTSDDLNGRAVAADGVTPVTFAGLVWLNDLNVLNTITPVENLTVKVAAVAPGTDVTMADWFNATGKTNGDNIAIAGEYKLAGVGTLGAGTSLDIDYLTSDGTESGPSTFMAAGAPARDWGTAVWFDANLSEILGADKGLFVSLDGQFGSYTKAFEQIASDASSTTDINEMQVGTMTRVNLYGETKMKLSDALTVSAGTLFSMGFGYDYASTNIVGGGTTTGGASWGDTGDKNFAIKENVGDTLYVSANYNEANYLNSIYGITPFELKFRADYIINKTATVWLSNGFKLNAGSLSDAALGAAPGKAMYGFYQKDAIELGVKLVSTPKSTLSISTGVNLFLGVPSASDVHAPAATDAQNKAVDAAYGAWYSKNFNPFSAKVAYTYTY